jgi:hypothetical protein
MKLRIEYWKAADKKWYFHFKARNGKILAASKGYDRLRSILSTMCLFTPIPSHYVAKQIAKQEYGSVYFRA